MIKEIEKVKQGCEKVVAVLDEVIADIETAKQSEIVEAIANINAKYDERLETYKSDRQHYVEIEIVEEPDETVEETSETENAVETENKIIGE